MLSVRGLTKIYANRFDAQAGGVRDVSIELPAGSFFTLLGPSGCGKTTMLRCVAGLERPDAGRIAVPDRVLFDSATGVAVPMNQRGIGMVFQSYAIWPHMTVFENVAFPLRVAKGRRLAKQDISRMVDQALTTVGLADYGDRPATRLSGGQQQRVALARAIVHRPQLLLLDEPLSNLDANLREEMRSEIRRLHDAFRITTVYVTHDQAEAMVTSDRIVVMNHGRIEQVDDPVTLYNVPRTRFVAGFIGRTNFLDGRVDGDRIVFDGFTVPAGSAPAGVAGASFAVRPQTIALHRTGRAVADSGWWVEGRVTERAYLGEYWEYVVRPANGGLRLRVTTTPADVYQADEAVWLEIDPGRIARIPSPEGAA